MSEEEAAERAEQLERKAHDAIAEFSLEDGFRLLRGGTRERSVSASKRLCCRRWNSARCRALYRPYRTARPSQPRASPLDPMKKGKDQRLNVRASRKPSV
jgi:hypothetical protein